MKRCTTKAALVAAAILVASTGCGKKTPSPSGEEPEVAAAPFEGSATAEHAAEDAASAQPGHGDAGAAWVKTLEHAEGAALRPLFDAELRAAEAAGKHVVVMFTADWCTPCRAIKDGLHDSPKIAGATTDGRFLIIDVDDWRGEAQSLIPGTDPSKLPLLVRVDAAGAVVEQTFGTALGLISEDDMAANLKRLIAGQPPERPAYFDDEEAKMALVREDMRKQKERVADLAPFVAEVKRVEPLEGGRKRVVLDLTMRVNEAPRRFWVMPTTVDVVAEPLAVEGWQMMRFDEHVRAGVSRWDVAGDGPDIDLLPVAGWGDAVLHGVTVEVPADAQALKVYRLSSAALDDDKVQFEKKVPYALVIADAGALVPRSPPNHRRGTLALKAAETFTIPLE